MKFVIPIIYEDNDVAVINKPAGITVNSAETTKDQQTVQDWAEEKFSIEKSNLKSSDEKKFGDEGWDPRLDFYSRGGIVHRLDKETSGLLLIAKNPDSFVVLQKQFKERDVKKAYVALAHGYMAPEKGEIKVPVGRLPWNRNRFGVLPGGKESVTNYAVIRYYQLQKSGEKLSFVELYPHSGRTHQIRVHLKYTNHPVFSDFLYAGRKTARNDRKLLERVFLHASKIRFRLPSNNGETSFEAPLPDELTNFLDTLTVMTT